MKIMLVAVLALSLGVSDGQVIMHSPARRPVQTERANASRLVRDTVNPGPTTMKLTTTINNKMSAGFLCEGFVRQPNFQPIAGFIVTADGGVQVHTGSDGSFRIPLKKGRLLLFSKPGYVTVQMDPFNEPNFSSSLMRVTMTVTEQFYFAHVVNTGTVQLFPLPCPSPSGIYNLDANLFSQLHTLGEVNELLKSSLDNCRYDEKRWYCVPHGFALVTAMEQTADDGVPLNPPERWSAVVAEELNSPLDYLKALFSAPEGYFRVFVFVVTDADLNVSGKGVSEDEARKWLGQGYGQLPEELRAQPITPSHAYSLLVYQYKKEPGQQGKQVRELTARQHFQASHLEQFLTTKR